jgi:hypothetical protein
MTHTEAHQRFHASKTVGFDEWHDGEGYDLDAYAAMSAEDREAEAARIRGLSNPDWRDLEVLRIHGGRESIEHLRHLLLHPSIDTRAHALGELIDGGHTPGAVPDVQLAHILDAIEDDEDGMTHSLLLAQNHAGPISKLALLRGAKGKPPLSLHFMSALFDRAELSDDMAAFDPKFRPLLLRLLPNNATDDRVEAFNECCGLMKIDPKAIPEPDDRGAWSWAEKTWPRD